jgi:chemotaxis signal transduction protein
MCEANVKRPSSVERGAAESARRVGEAFDASFREEYARGDETTLDLLTVRIGAELIGVLVDHVIQVETNARVLAVPGAPPSCSGIAAHRSKLVAVFELGRLLGLSGGEGSTLLLVSRRDPAVAFAATSMDRYRRVSSSALVPYATNGDPIRLGTLSGETPALVISLDALVSSLERNAIVGRAGDES